MSVHACAGVAAAPGAGVGHVHGHGRMVIHNQALLGIALVINGMKVPETDMHRQCESSFACERYRDAERLHCHANLPSFIFKRGVK
jgi:hypothetical protein